MAGVDELTADDPIVYGNNLNVAGFIQCWYVGPLNQTSMVMSGRRNQPRSNFRFRSLMSIQPDWCSPPM
jgi:hypothetical protein